MTAIGPGGEPQRFYRVKVSALSPEQIERVIRFAAEKFGIPEDEVRADVMGEIGIPLLADDVSVSFDARLVM